MLQLYKKAVPNAPHLLLHVSQKTYLFGRKTSADTPICRKGSDSGDDGDLHCMGPIHQLCVEVNAVVMKGRSTACIVFHNTTPLS